MLLEVAHVGDGRALRPGDSDTLKAFEASSEKDQRNVSDDLFAAVVADKLQDRFKALSYLEHVVESDIELPDALMLKYLPQQVAEITVRIAITPLISAELGLSSLAAALILGEHYQTAGRLEEAIGLLQQLREEAGEDPALTLSLCELLFEDQDDDGVIETAVGAENDSDIGLAILHLKGKALARRGLSSGALETFAHA